MNKLFTLLAAAAASVVGTGVSAQAAEYIAPVKLEINSQEAFDQWTTFNSNGDAYEFVYSSDQGGALVDENKSMAANDWLISPAVEVKAGKTYVLTLYAKNVSTYSSDKSIVSLYAGDAATVEAQTTKVFGTVTLQSKYFTSTNMTGNFTATSDGEVYFGVHVTSSSYNGGTAVQYLNIEEVAVLPSAPTNLSISAGAEGALSAVLTWNQPATDQFGAALTELSGAKIYRGTSIYFTVSDTYLVGTVEAATPGQEVSWTDETLTSAGKYYYRVAAYNESGAGAACTGVQSPYIGTATSVPNVTNVVAEALPDNDKTVSLTWTQPAPTEGYFNPADVAYKITRADNGSSTSTTLEEAWSGEQPYLDNSITGLGSYVYTVYTVYNNSTGWSGTKSNAVVTGGCATLPYSQDFSNSNSLSLFTLIHGADAAKDWGLTSGKLYYWGNPADAWAITPKFQFEKGKVYELSFDTYVQRASSPKYLAVTLGLEATTEGMDTETVFDELIENTSSATKKVVFTVAEDGEYYVGFHCYGPSDSNDIYVDNLKLEETIAVPLAVTELNALAGADGALSVELSWLNPSLTTAGDEIENIDRLVVLNGTETVATLENQAAGQNSSVEIAVDKAGIHSFSVVAYLGEDAGEAATVTTPWIGPDTPKAPAEVSATLDGEQVNVTFEAVTEGEHGGYVNPDEIVYTIKRNDDVLTDDCVVTSYYDPVDGIALGMYTYSVAARYNDQESDFTSAASLMLGDAMSLPYRPDLTDASARALFTISKKANGGNSWTYNSSKEAWASDGNNATLITPPLTIYQGSIRVSWKATCYNARYTEDFEILLCTNNDPENLDVVSTIATPHVETVSWPSTVSADAEVEADGKYYIAFRLPTEQWTLYIYQTDVEQLEITGLDNVSIEGNALSYNRGLRSLNVPGAGIVSVSRLDGVTVVRTRSNGEAVNLGHLAAGVYVATWTDAEGNVLSCKFIY